MTPSEISVGSIPRANGLLLREAKLEMKFSPEDCMGSLSVLGILLVFSNALIITIYQKKKKMQSKQRHFSTKEGLFILENYNHQIIYANYHLHPYICS